VQALVLGEQAGVRSDYPLPAPSRTEALVRVSVAGVCRTDIELSKGYMDFAGVPGHEFVGVVEECVALPGIVGKRVVGEINCPCLDCRLCRAGLTNHCPSRTVLGISGRDGGFAEYVVLPAGNLHEVPDGLSDEEAVFAEPLAAAFRILQQGAVPTDGDVLVMGDGKLGLLAAQVARLVGASVHVVGRHLERAELLRHCSVNFHEAEVTPTHSFDAVVECTGDADALAQALKLCRPGGTVVLKTTTTEPNTLNLTEAVVNEIKLLGSRCGPFAPALRALADGTVRVGGMVEATYDLSDGLAALEHAARSGTLKILIQP